MNVRQLDTILVIDDNPSNLKLLHELLRVNGYRVRVADTPSLGLESARQYPPDLILLDIKLPDMDGYTVCRKLKEDPETESIPIIFISAADSPVDKVQAFEAGGMDYISKPFDASEVLARIDNHLQLSHLQKQTLRSLDTSQHMLQAVMNNSPTVIYIKDLQARYLMVNKEFERLMQIKNEDIIGKKDTEVFPKKLSDIFTRHDREILEGITYKEYEDNITLNDNELSYLFIKFPLKDSGGNYFALCGIATDITMRKQAEAELEHMATYDSLTELPNRGLFTELLTRTLASSKRDNSRHAILFIDLDNFKNINDSLGHHSGDQLLKDVAKRLKECTRSQDTVSRMGGDEFALLQQRIKTPSEAAEVCKKIINKLAPPFEIEGRSVYISPSIGITISPDNGQDATSLLRNADTAMYAAKDKGRNTYQFFTDEMNQRVLERMEVEKELRIALEQKNITPFYQPKINSQTGEINSVETLARWHHEEQGFISPQIFIPIAEESNLIIALDRYILENAIRQFTPLVQQGLFKGTVSINLSAHHFFRNELLEYIDEILQKQEFPPSQLEIEITEGTVMTNTAEAIKLMMALHERGIKLSIDDFGTGYSSLSYLKQFPVNSLKIDISFIRDITKSDADKNLVESIINLAHGLELNCIAEGVETNEQAKMLQELNCDGLQGYLFSPAIDFESLSDLLQKKQCYSELLVTKN